MCFPIVMNHYASPLTMKTLTPALFHWEKEGLNFISRRPYFLRYSAGPTSSRPKNSVTNGQVRSVR
jgi:hypothetical protein